MASQIIRAQPEGCYDYTLDFESGYCLDQLMIDTISNQNNIWHIGSPQKAILSSARSGDNVIITDSAQFYPVNDTSVFIVKNPVRFGFAEPHSPGLFGYYWVDSDSLNDYGIIEFSPDNGITWINLISDSVYGDYIEPFGTLPTLTGNSNGWQSFYIDLKWLVINFFDFNEYDTVQFRFTFVSDSIENSRGGLMFDDLYFEDYIEGLSDIIMSSKSILIAPNPARDFIRVSSLRDLMYFSQYRIFSLQGSLIQSSELNHTKTIEIETTDFRSGTYLLEATSSDYSLTFRQFFIVNK